MSQEVILLTTVLSILLAISALGYAIYEIAFRDRWQMQSRLADQFGAGREAQIQHSPLFRDLKLLHAKTSRPQVGLWSRLLILIEQSGLTWTAERIVSASAFLAIVSGSIAAFFLPWPLLGIPIGISMGAIPLTIVEICRQRRRDKLCQQLAEAFDQMKRAMRSGQTIASALQMAAADLKSPLADELTICCQQQGLGLPFQVTLQDLSRRTGIMELHIFTVALQMQRESGGNCLEMMGNLAELVRKRLQLKHRIKALTGEGRLQAIVLGLLPLVAFLAIQLISPQYADVLLDRPMLLGGLLASEILGALWIRRIVNIDY